jgi:hypothetical protein
METPALAQPPPLPLHLLLLQEHGEALQEHHTSLHHHTVVLLEFSLNISSLLAGSRRRRHLWAARVLNAEAPSVRCLVGSTAI